MAKNIIVAGIGTGVGKTVVASILAYALNADYWKPVQCGIESDSAIVEELIGKGRTFPESVHLKTPRSPHHAAALEGVVIDPVQIVPPQTDRRLIIEGCGGVLVPLSLETSMLDLFSRWDNCAWVLVSRHYLGSINHTLLTIEALKRRLIAIKGIVFNGPYCPETEAAILSFSQIPCIARLTQESQWNTHRVHKFARQWLEEKAFHNAIHK